jgi:hypothetical protein
LVVLLSFCPALGFAAVDWPFFLSDAGRSASNGALLQRSQLEPKWSNKNAAQGLVNYSSPIVAGDRVFIGNSAGELKAYDLSPNAIYLSAHLGLNKELWSFKASGPVYSTPAYATAGATNFVFAGTTDGNLYALRADTGSVLGQALWHRAVGGAILASPVVANVPVIGPVVFCASNDGSLRAFKADATGTPLWSVNTGSLNYASPTYDAARNYVYQAGYNGDLIAINASTGALVWTQPVGPTRATPALFGGLIFTVNRAGLLRVLDPNPALNSFQRELANRNFPGGVAASPAVTSLSGITRIILLEQSGRLLAVNYSGGSLSSPVWADPPLSVPVVMIPSNASVALAGNLVIFGRENGQISFFDLITGISAGPVLSFTQSVQISPAVGQNTLLIGHSGGDLEALGMPVAGFVWAGPTTISANVPTTFTLTAVDLNGNAVPSFAGAVSAGIVGSNPLGVFFDFGKANVVITATSPGPIVLRANNGGGVIANYNVNVAAATPTPTFTPTISPTPSATPSATPSPSATETPEIAPVCASYSLHTLAFYGGNSDGQLLDSSGHGQTLGLRGTVLNPAGGQPEGDRWLGAGFSGLSPENWLTIPNAAWPGSAQGAVEVKLGYHPVDHVQEQVFLAQNGGQYCSVYITTDYVGVDSTAGGPFNFYGLHNMTVAGQIYTLRLEWDSLGMRVRIDNNIKTSTPRTMDLSATTSMLVGAIPTINDRDLRSKIDALALLNDADASPCDDFVNSPSPTASLTASPLVTATPSPTPSPSFSSTRTVTPSRTRTSTRTVTPTRSATGTPTPSPSPSFTGTETEVPTPPPAPIFMAVVATGGEMTAGSNVLVDSYDSRVAPYSAATAGDEGDVMARGSIDIKGSTVIHGELFPNTPSNLYASMQPLSLASLGDLVVAANTTLVLPAGDYLYDNIDIQGGATLQVQGRARLWFRQTLSIQGNAAALSQLPADLSFFGTSDATDVSLLGSPIVYGVIYAPSAAMHVSGHSVVYGALAAATVDLSGNAELHYDLALVNGDYHQLLPGQSAGGLSVAGVKFGPKARTTVAWLPKGKDLAIAPNPSARDITLGFRLAEPAQVRVLISDLTGNLIQVIDLGRRPAGEQVAGSSVGALASGIYIAGLEVNEGFGARVRAYFKMAVVR